MKNLNKIKKRLLVFDTVNLFKEKKEFEIKKKYKNNFCWKMKKIFISEPSFNSKEKSSLLKCLDSGFISSIGNNVVKFENEIKKYTKAKFCVACINGTSALHVSLKVIGVEKNHEVIAPTMSFIATVNSILYIGASPIFMDCDEYLNIDLSKTINFIKKNTFTVKNKTFNKKTKKRISAVVVAHMYGNLCDFTKLKKICFIKRY